MARTPNLTPATLHADGFRPVAEPHEGPAAAARARTWRVERTYAPRPGAVQAALKSLLKEGEREAPGRDVASALGRSCDRLA